MIENPFLVIDRRFNHIEALLKQLKDSPAAAHPPADRIYTKPEAAEFLHISEQTLNGYVSANKIPFCKPTDGKVYFLHSDLIDWLKQHRTATVADQVAQYEQARATRRTRATSATTSTRKAA